MLWRVPFDGLEKWPFRLFIEGLPTVLQVTLFFSPAAVTLLVIGKHLRRPGRYHIHPSSTLGLQPLARPFKRRHRRHLDLVSLESYRWERYWVVRGEAFYCKAAPGQLFLNPR